MDTRSKESLMKYVNNLDLNTSNDIKRITINYGEIQPMTLYRGQKTNTLNSTYWFSSSSSIDVAKKDFAKESGYTFIIHVDDAKILDVNSYLTEREIGEHISEKECIVQGGGKFYTNSEFECEGFVQLGENYIETCSFSAEMLMVL